jgi:hypothetical protein
MLQAQNRTLKKSFLGEVFSPSQQCETTAWRQVNQKCAKKKEVYWAGDQSGAHLKQLSGLWLLA